uniref:Ribosome biogenesis regulatory protein n=1 Tax=Steinernema glaseri TaxID=37863 RepID=A0A1I7YTH5_9BILA
MSVNVNKLVDPNIDLGNLLVVDRDPLPEEEHEIDDEFLLGRTRENVQLLFNKIWQLERKIVDGAHCAVLPDPTIRLPREKIIPERREPTKWEKFAAEKGIMKRKKDQKVYDNQTGEWKPTYGYRRANDNTKDWLLEVPDNQDPYRDFFGERIQDKKDRVAKNELQRLQNIARTVKPAQKEQQAPIGATTDAEKSKQELDEQIYRAKVATASIGKHQEALKNEKTKPKGKRHQFAPNFGDSGGERKRHLEILDSIGTKKPKIAQSRLNAALEGQEISGSNDDTSGGKKQKKGGVRQKSSIHRQKHFEKMKKGKTGGSKGGKMGGRK